MVRRDQSGGSLISRRYIKEVRTKHAAVNGQNNTREQAVADVMRYHLNHAYSEDKISEFTLFHNPTVNVLSDTFESTRDKLGMTNPMTKRFARVLDETQQRNHQVGYP